MTRLIVIRPEPGCAATLAAARGMGIEAQGFPLFEVRALDWEPVAANDVDALLLGSANALRHGGAALALYAGKPAYAVGEATAEAARDAGLDVATTGRGGLQALLEQVAPQHRRLLRLAGRERVTLDMPPGIELIERVVYASEALPMPPALAECLRDSPVVLLHSAEAARHLAGQCKALGIARGAIRLAAIGARVAAAAGPGWAECRSATSPDDAALLALAAQMCEERPTKT